MIRRDIRFGAAAVHLWHPSRQPPLENPNDAIEASTVARALVRCEHGLDRHLPALTAGPDPSK